MLGYTDPYPNCTHPSVQGAKMFGGGQCRSVCQFVLSCQWEESTSVAGGLMCYVCTGDELCNPWP